MNTKEKIAVMQAFEDGEEIERKFYATGSSWVLDKSPKWNWLYEEYRVKPREWWVNIANGLHTNSRPQYEQWLIDYDMSEIVKVREDLDD